MADGVSRVDILLNKVAFCTAKFPLGKFISDPIGFWGRFVADSEAVKARCS